MKEMISWVRKKILSVKRSYFIILAVTFLVYFPILFFNFTYLDDNNLIIDHAEFLNNFFNIFESFRHDVFLSAVGQAYYRPIMTISLILDAQIGGSSPFIYHFTDLLIHLLVTSLIFVFFQKLKYRKDLSLLFTLIFGIHPVLSQAVSWIPGRNDTFLALFVLLSFIAFINFLETEEKRYIKWYLLWFTLAIFTKETAFMIILIQLFYFYCIYKKNENSISRFKNKSSNIKLIAIGWAIITGIFFLMRHFAFQSPINFGLSDITKSIFNNSPAYIQFIGKIIFPFNLSTYPIIQDTTFVYGIIAIILILIGMILTKNKKYPNIIFGLLWFFLFLTPTLVRPNTNIFSDFIEHRLYLPVIGFFLLITETDFIQRFSYKKTSSIVISSIIISLFIPITIINSQNFKNRMTFWNNATKYSPHAPLAHRNLGAMLFLDGKLDEAKPEFEKALELNPKEEMAHNNLGLIYMNKGEFEKAEEEFNKELEVNPYYDNAYANKGILYYKMGRMDEAVNSWKKTLEINPGYSEALYNLFAYYYQKQDKENIFYWANEAQKRGIELLPEMRQLINPLESLMLRK